MSTHRLLTALSLAAALGAARAVRAEDKPAAPEQRKDAKPPAAQKAGAKESAPVPPAIHRPPPRDLDEALRWMDRIRVRIEFRDTPLEDAVEFIRRVSGFNVIVGPELQQKGLDGIPRITFKLHDVTLRQLADLVCRFTGTRLKCERGILEFTTPEAARGKPVLCIYSIAELTMKIRNFPGPDLNLRPAGAEFEEEEESETAGAFSDPEQIVELIRKTVAEDTWDDEGVSIWADERKLIVRQYPQVQREIRRLLALLRAAS